MEDGTLSVLTDLATRLDKTLSFIVIIHATKNTFIMTALLKVKVCRQNDKLRFRMRDRYTHLKAIVGKLAKSYLITRNSSSFRRNQVEMRMKNIQSHC